MPNCCFYVLRHDIKQKEREMDDAEYEFDDRPPLPPLAIEGDVVELSESAKQALDRFEREGEQHFKKTHGSWWDRITAPSFDRNAVKLMVRFYRYPFCETKYPYKPIRDGKSARVLADDVAFQLGTFYDLESAIQASREYVAEQERKGFEPRRSEHTRQEPMWQKMGYTDPIGYQNEFDDD
jgi:hypothetical protein